MYVKLFTSQLVSLQLQGGMLGPIQIVLVDSLFRWHLHFTAYAIINYYDLKFLLQFMCIVGLGDS